MRKTNSMIPKGVDHRVVCMLYGGPDRLIYVAGKRWRFEDHPYCGPIPIGKNGAPVREPPENSPFWEAVSLWHEQGKRTQQFGNEIRCVWEPKMMRKMQHLGGKHYLMVSDEQSSNAQSKPEFVSTSAIQD